MRGHVGRRLFRRLGHALLEFSDLVFGLDYVWMIGSIAREQARELILQRETAPDFDPAEMTDEELASLIEAERRRQIICRALGKTKDR